MDSSYIFSGSDETNIRAWKANANEKIGHVSKREKLETQYREKLVNKFKYTNDIKWITKPHLPKYLLTAKKLQHIQWEKKQRKMENMKYNNDTEFEVPEPETKRKVVKTEE